MKSTTPCSVRTWRSDGRAPAEVNARDEQYRNPGTRLCQAAGDLEAAGLAEAHIEEDRVRGEALGGRDG